MEKPLIVIDVGNSRIKLGLFDRDDTSPLPEFHAWHAQDASLPFETAELHSWTQSLSEPIPAIITGSSPAGIDSVLESWSLQAVTKPAILQDRKLLGIEVDVPFPEKVGMDRLLNVVAVNRLRKSDQPALVVDSGTATTVDLIDSQGVFQGGAILPGLRLSARALHQYTQLLPEIPLDELESGAKGPIGKETREAIRSGLYWGQLGAIRELTDRILDSNAEACRILTGGGAELLSKDLSDFKLVSHLSLRGFALLADQILD